MGYLSRRVKKATNQCLRDSRNFTNEPGELCALIFDSPYGS